VIKADILTRINECYVEQIEGQPNPAIDEPEMRAHRVVGDGNDIYPERPKSEWRRPATTVNGGFQSVLALARTFFAVRSR
jgi:hypothetical protein